jgi:hypothetical protein
MWAGLVSSATGWAVGASENLNSAPHILVTRTSGELLVNATTATGTSLQKLQVTGGAYVSGNLGIGITNPTYGVHIQGTSIAEIGFTATGTGGDNFRVGSGSNAAGFDGLRVYDVNASAERLRVDGSGNIVINSTTSTGTVSQPLQVTGGAYVSGNIGVGVTNPGSKLDIVGDIRFGKQDYSFQSIQKVATLNADGISGVYPTGSFRFYTYPGYINTSTLKLGIRGQDDVLGETSDLVTIVSTSATSGNIGIGTTNPSQKLHVQGNARITGELYDFNNGAGSTGQILQSVGTGISWTTFSGGSTVTVSDDTTTNATRYLIFEDVTSGTSSSINVSSTKLTFNPSTGALSATDFNSTSDINLKENIKPIENSLDKIMQLNGIEFDWKENKKPSIGVIAQEVEKVFPSLVKTAENKSVNYNGLVGVLIEAIKELKKEVEDLKIAKYT